MKKRLSINLKHRFADIKISPSFYLKMSKMTYFLYTLFVTISVLRTMEHEIKKKDKY